MEATHLTYQDTLRSAGYRVTRPRQAILDVLVSADELLLPEEIQRRALPLCPGIGLATIYRTLALLSELGCVRRVHRDDHCQGYAPASRSHSHHLVCRGCAQVVEFEGSEDIAGVIVEVADRTGFRIEDHLLELVGTCPNCQLAAPSR